MTQAGGAKSQVPEWTGVLCTQMFSSQSSSQLAKDSPSGGGCRRHQGVELGLLQ